MSPDKRRAKRDASVSKDDYRRQRREQRKKEQAEKERKEKLPPTQHSFVKIKTSIGKHPVINYLSQFTNDEIQEGKKHLLNRWRVDPNKKVHPLKSSSPSKRGAGEAGAFKIDVNDAQPGQDDSKPDDGEQDQVENKPQPAMPKSRAPGGIWLTQSDFPHAFQNVIVYHNP